MFHLCLIRLQSDTHPGLQHLRQLRWTRDGARGEGLHSPATPSLHSPQRQRTPVTDTSVPSMTRGWLSRTPNSTNTNHFRSPRHTATPAYRRQFSPEVPENGGKEKRPSLIGTIKKQIVALESVFGGNEMDSAGRLLFQEEALHLTPPASPFQLQLTSVLEW